MRVSLIAAVALVATAIAAPAAHASPRTAEAPYQISGVQGVADGSVGAQGSGSGPAVFATRRFERTVALRLNDRTGAAVPATVKQPTGTPGRYVLLGEICGATQKPLRLALPGQPLVVAPVAGICDGSPGVPMTGQAHAEFR